MKTILLTLLTFFVFSIGFSQKIKIKNDIVSIDGTPAFKMELRVLNEMMILSDLDGKKLAIFQMEAYNDSKYISQGNPNGRVTYYSATFYDENMSKCEFDAPGLRKAVARYINDFGLIKDNQLDEAAVAQFVKIHGTKFSDERNSSSTIIIINR